MQKSNSAVNQQETVSEVEKGWLAGIIDGEGCIHIDLDPKGGSHPYLTITNSNKLIIEKVVSIWHRLGVGCRVQTRANYRKNPVQDVQVIGFKRLQPALIAIMPYLIGKANEALLLYRFVESRLLKADNHLTNAERAFSIEEMNLIYALKEYKHHNRISSETNTLDYRLVEDRVRATRRLVETGRNSQSRLISG